MNKLLKTCLIVLLLVFPLVSLAQNLDANSGSYVESCNTGNASNLGQHIIDYTLCGASFLHPKSTLFGTFSLVINTIALTVSLYLLSVNGLKYAFFTMQHGVPGGQKIQGGIMVIRSGLLVGLLAPIVANGYSPIQVFMRDFTELGAWFADIGANRIANFVSSDGPITNVDPANIEDITKQIVISEMCARAFYIYNQFDAAVGMDQNPDAGVKPVTTGDSSSFNITWKYIDPYRAPSSNDAWVADNQREMPNQDLMNPCGSIGIALPNAITGLYYDATFDTFSSNSLLPSQRPYLDALNNQYSALKAHIARVRSIISNSTSDLEAITKASAIASQNPSDAALDAVSAAQDAEASQVVTISANSSLINSQLLQANDQYNRDIIAAGQAVVGEIDANDGVVSQDCINAGPDCVAHETWVQQINRQGFAALGAYYFVFMLQNQKIQTVQQHFMTAADLAPIYNIGYSESDKRIVASLIDSPIFNQVNLRTKTYINNFNKSVTATRFNISYSSIENLGNSTENPSISAKVSELITKITAPLAKGIMNWIKGNSDSGDIILHLVNIGVLFNNSAGWILGILVGGAIIGKILGSTVVGKAVGTAIGGEGSIIKSILTGLFWTMIFLYLAGGLLQYVIPSIPLFKWLLEIQSWAFMMFMAFVYAPLWVMAHASITDDRFMAEQTMTGYGLIFELILRPILMVASFFAMIMLLHVADIGFTLAGSYLLGLGSYGTIGPITMFFIIFIAIFIALQLSMRTFDIIPQLPDFIIQRINFGARPLGDTMGDRSHSTAVAAFTQRVVKTGTSAVAGGVDKVATSLGLIAKTKPKDNNSITA